MSEYISKQEHISWAIRRALTLYDQGERQQAISSFVTDLHHHPATEHLVQNPFTLVLLREKIGSREEFEQAMWRFATS